MSSLIPFARLDKLDKELTAIKTQKVLWGILAENSDSNNYKPQGDYHHEAFFMASNNIRLILLKITL